MMLFWKLLRLRSRLRSDDHATREAAANALVEIGPTAVPHVLVALCDPDQRVQMLAARVLGRLKDPRAVDSLVASLGATRGSVQVGLEKELIGALASIGNAPAIGALVSSLKKERLRDPAAVALAKLGGTAVEHVGRALADNDEEVRCIAAEVLGRMGNAGAAPFLAAALHDRSYQVRGAAVEAILQLADPDAVQTLRQCPDAVDLLSRSLATSDSSKRLAAVRALRGVGGARAAVPLAVRCDDKSPDVRKAVEEALREIGNPRVVAELIGLLRAPKKGDRAEAAIALGGLGQPEAAEPLIAALRDEDGYVRASAARALGRIPAPQALVALLTALHDTDSTVQQHAAEALGKIGNASAVGPLLQTLPDAGRNTRLAAIQAIGEIGSVTAVPDLLATLHDEDILVRVAAEVALGALGDRRAVEPLIARLKRHRDAEMNTYEVAALVDALGRIGDPRAVEPVVTILCAPCEWRVQDWWYEVDARKAAAEALGKIAHASTIALLQSALKTQAWQIAKGIEVLEVCLTRSAKDVPEHALRAVASLPDTVPGVKFSWIPPVGSDRGGAWKTTPDVVSCVAPRRLARQELDRRGLT
jgi:HEAT repeat protein